MSLRSVDPSTDRVIREYDEMPAAELANAVDRAAATQRRWARASFAERAAHLRTAAGLLRRDAAEYARLMASEMGKPLPQGRAEVHKSARVCDHYADHGKRLLEDDLVDTEARLSFVTYRPLGTVLAIMPWNFPFWQVFRCAAPNLMAGNAVLLKHASNVQGCALAIEDLLDRAGIPRGLFRALVVPSGAVGGIIEHDGVAAVTLTGSSDAGRAVARRAGAALKKTVLELGGSDPYLVLEDADLERAVSTCVAARLVNGGQSCIAAKRFIVVRTVAEEFLGRMTEAMRARTFGNPLAREDVDLGPLARPDLRDALHGQVRASVADGAELRCGGRVPDGPGAFYPPTVLAGVRPGMPAYDEETFGPVASIVPVADEDEGIAVANDTSFGLGAAVFTRDVQRGERIARDQLQAGCCFVNEQVQSDLRLPFGGVKESGYGRELGRRGIREFVNTKTVWIG